MIPFRTPFILPLLYPTLMWREPLQEPTLYLTFDDGPMPGPTDFVLEQLKAKNIEGTFFCIGDNIRKHQETFAKIFDSNHAIGNHTFNHLNGWKTERQKYYENICQCQMMLDGNKKTGRTSSLFRPPYGRITFPQVRMLSNFRIVMWDVLTHDYNKGMSPEYCLKKSIAATRNGSIVVFHDSLKAERNMRYVLPRYIDHFASQGYTFKKIVV